MADLTPESFFPACEARYGGRCANCGGLDRLAPRWAIDPEDGGHRVESNTVLLCRSCALGAVASARLPENTPASLWVSVPLHDWVLSQGGSTFLRRLVEYLADAPESDLDDLAMYQDPDSPATRLHFRLDSALYHRALDRVRRSGFTFTDALTHLAVLRRTSPIP